MLNHHALWSLQTLNPADLLMLIDSARQLQRAASLAEGSSRPLRGRNLALLSDDHASPAADAFLRAATSLGAQVARVRASEPPSAALRPPHEMAGLFGQLYDAIECQGLSEADLLRLDRDAGVPVFNGLASAGQPLHAVATLMAWQDLGGDRPPPAQGAVGHVAALLGLSGDNATTASPPPEAVARHVHHLLQAALSCTLT